MADIQSKLVGAVGSVLQTALGAEGVKALKGDTKTQEQTQRAQVAKQVVSEVRGKEAQVYAEHDAMIKKAKELGGTESQIKSAEKVAFERARDRVNKIRSNISHSIDYMYATGKITKSQHANAIADELIQSGKSAGQPGIYEYETFEEYDQARQEAAITDSHRERLEDFLIKEEE